MLPDHYATLGVRRTSHDAVIRAAYLALMRRYHPDKNRSASAAAHVRVVTAAYAVLGDEERRARYDFRRAQAIAASAAFATASSSGRWRPTAWHAAPFAAAAVLLLLVVLLPSPLMAPEPSERALRVQARQAAAPREQQDSEARPQLEGQRALRANTDYSLQVVEGGTTDVVSLSDVKVAMTPLATPAKMPHQAPEPVDPPFEPEEAAPTQSAPVIQKTPRVVQRPSPTVARAEPQRWAPHHNPSFSCPSAKSRGEIGVCNNAHLAALDRLMALRYGQSLGRAGAETKAMLLRTHDPFIARRNSCSSDACIRGAYVGRLREISDAVGSSQPPR